MRSNQQVHGVGQPGMAEGRARRIRSWSCRSEVDTYNSPARNVDVARGRGTGMRAGVPENPGSSDRTATGSRLPSRRVWVITTYRVEAVTSAYRLGRGPAFRRKLANCSPGDTSQASHQSANSATSTLRLPVSQLYTQEFGFPRRSPSFRCVSPAASRSSRRRAGTCR